jgi:hypothetical protein
MHPRSFDTAEKILQYTAVAANALHDVAAATQIPFLDSFCTLSLTIIPMVQVGQSESESLSCLNDIEGLEVSQRPIPQDNGGDSSVAVRADDLVHALGRDPSPQDARPNCAMCPVGPMHRSLV